MRTWTGPVRELQERCWAGLLAFVALATLSGQTLARGTYQDPAEFLRETFENRVPPPTRLPIGDDLRGMVKEILGHDLGVSRLRYWSRDGRTAWILEEIGKTQPITTGIVVSQGRIERIKVLVFRESRGWEVRYPFFTDQFRGASLTDQNRLDRDIDGISGATLSVRALEKLSRLVLLLHEHVERTATGKQ
ncbi:MAG: FMN-binding protein [Gammaproteobacteria bacterium]